MARRQGNEPDLQATALVATRQAEVTRWEEAHHTYRAHLETLALTLPPFRVADFGFSALRPGCKPTAGDGCSH
jgi:hypothetical protein